MRGEAALPPSRLRNTRRSCARSTPVTPPAPRTPSNATGCARWRGWPKRPETKRPPSLGAHPGTREREETSMTTGIPRRTLLINGALAGGAAFFGPWRHHHVYAAKADKPILIGLTHDASGQFANSGQDEQRGTIMAIEEANAKGGVLGRKLTYITADTETTPATGSRVAERMITRNEVTFLVGAIQSGVANAIGQVANKYGVIYLNTNSSAPSEAGENCSRIKFVWDGNGTNFSKAAVQNAVEKIGKKGLLLTTDYVWGHTTSAATKAEVEKAGGQIIDNLLVPQNTRDFTSYLLKVQQAKPDVVAMAIGGDDMKALRQQISSLKLEEKTAWINNQ